MFLIMGEGFWQDDIKHFARRPDRLDDKTF